MRTLFASFARPSARPGPKSAKDSGCPKNAVSQLEGRSDLLLSTLRRYVKALGADLDIVVRMKDGSKVVLEGIGAMEGSGDKRDAAKKKRARAGHRSEPRSSP